MATFVSLAKYSSSAMAAIRTTGFASRQAQMEVAMADVGAKLIAVHFMNSTVWDFMMIFEADSDAQFTLGSVSTASGAFERTETYELRSAAELDALRTRSVTWTAPQAAT